MAKTLLSKFTGKSQSEPSSTHQERSAEQFAMSVTDQQLLTEASKDLLSPRPEAIKKLLELSRSI